VPDQLSRLWSRAADAIVVIAVVAGVLLGTYGVWTIHETHQIVVSHNTELAQTNEAVRHIEELQKTSTSNHSGTLIYLEAICASTPGCPAALQQLEGG
jgi:Na+/H+ antiporter NhaB